MTRFRYRGVVEGFYGPPWSHCDRLWMLERMGRWGMNRYVYAPKDDPWHRERWREAYPKAAREEFAELVRAGADAGVGVGFALSPGLSIVYSSESDRAALVAKLEGFAALGARLLVLAVDDVPARLVHAEDRGVFASLAAAHGSLVHALRQALGPEVALWLVPTDYLGVEPTDYLLELGRELPEEVEVGWTGRTVLSPTVETGEACARADTLRRRPWLWDNLPVADGPMRNMLHLAPYLGRDPDLDQGVCGVLLNPMQHARASALTLQTAAAYLDDPTGYDPEAAWGEAIEALGAGAPDAARRFALAHRFAPQSHVREPELEPAYDQLTSALSSGGDVRAALAALRAGVEARVAAAEELRAGATDPAWIEEIEPWLESHRVETARMQVALEAMEALLEETSTGARLRAYSRMEGRLTRLCPTRAVSYGPRRVLYPQLRSMREEDMGFGDDACLLRGRCLADDVVDLVADLAVWLLAPAGHRDAGDEPSP